MELSTTAPHTRVVSVIPSEESLLRLVTGVLIENPRCPRDRQNLPFPQQTQNKRNHKTSHLP
jgi:hypothetical protein